MSVPTNKVLLDDFKTLITQISTALKVINQQANTGKAANLSDKLDKVSSLMVQAAILVEGMQKTADPELINVAKGMLHGRLKALQECRVTVMSKMKVPDEDPVLGSLKNAKISDLDPKIGSRVKDAFKELVKTLPSTQNERMKIVNQHKQGLSAAESVAFNKEITRLFSIYKMMAEKQEASRMQSFDMKGVAGKSDKELMDRLKKLNVQDENPNVEKAFNSLSNAEKSNHAGKSRDKLIGELDKVKTPDIEPDEPRTGPRRR